MRERRRSPVPPSSEAPSASSPDVEQRLADLERDLRKRARAARARAQRAAREAAAAAGSKTKRPSDEELGYIKTDDSFGKIVADGLDEVAEWLQRHSRHE